MKITYFGHSHFFIEGNEYSIVLDPFKNVGLKEHAVKSDYVFCSHEHFDHNNASLAIGAKRVLNKFPFEIIKSNHDEKGGTLRGKNDILIFMLDGVKLAFLGDLGEYSNIDIINKLNGIDVLLLPVGGKYTINANGAYEYAVKSKAKLIVPMHYKVPNSNIDIKGVQPFTDKFKNVKMVDGPFEYKNESGVIVITPKQEV